MIPTRQHAVFDYASAGLLGMLSLSRRLPRRTRRALRLSALATASVASQTDYEGGIAPRLPMRAHLALDLANGAALCAAGLRGRQPLLARVLLLGLGATAASVALRTAGTPVARPGRGSPLVTRLSGEPDAAGYPPLDAPKPVADGVWIVDSLMDGPGGLDVPVRMTVIRLPGGGLLLHSPVRLGTALQAAIEALGPVEHLVAPNSVHWLFVLDWQRAFPNATAWGAPGLRHRGQVRRAGLRLDRDLPEGTPPEWGGTVTLTTVPAAFGLREVAMLHAPTRTLVLTDLVLNLDPARMPALARPVLRVLGVTAPDGMPPPWARLVFRMGGAPTVRAAERLLREQPRRVIFAHGTWFDNDATARLRRSWRWLLPGAA